VLLNEVQAPEFFSTEDSETTVFDDDEKSGPCVEQEQPLSAARQ
jgi:hypothetical protein